MAWARSYSETIPILKEHINGLRHGLASVVPGDIRASWEGVDGARSLYDYAESHVGDAQFMSTLQRALTEEKISWLFSFGAAAASVLSQPAQSLDQFSGSHKRFALEEFAVKPMICLCDNRQVAQARHKLRFPSIIFREITEPLPSSEITELFVFKGDLDVGILWAYLQKCSSVTDLQVCKLDGSDNSSSSVELGFRIFRGRTDISRLLTQVASLSTRGVMVEVESGAKVSLRATQDREGLVKLKLGKHRQREAAVRNSQMPRDFTLRSNLEDHTPFVEEPEHKFNESPFNEGRTH